MTKQLGALIAEAKQSASIMELIASFEPQDIDGDDVDLRFEVDGFDTGCNVSLVERCGKASEQLSAMIVALEKAQQEDKVALKTIANLIEMWNEGRNRIAELEAMLQAGSLTGEDTSAELPEPCPRCGCRSSRPNGEHYCHPLAAAPQQEASDD
ncbi:hypothetical protein BXA22_04080 [Edwardsiella piscicida]|nr:hypothetical protein BXA22_04080 [Edwardsiella piscicida]